MHGCSLTRSRSISTLVAAPFARIDMQLTAAALQQMYRAVSPPQSGAWHGCQMTSVYACRRRSQPLPRPSVAMVGQPLQRSLDRCNIF